MYSLCYIKPFYGSLNVLDTADTLKAVLREEMMTDICMYSVDLWKNTIIMISSIIMGRFWGHVCLLSHDIVKVIALIVTALICIFAYNHRFIFKWRAEINKCRSRTIKLLNALKNGKEKDDYVKILNELNTVRRYYDESCKNPIPWTYT